MSFGKRIAELEKEVKELRKKVEEHDRRLKRHKSIHRAEFAEKHKEYICF